MSGGGSGSDLPADGYWVIEGRLMAGTYPGSESESVARANLEALLDEGVTCFLDLTEGDDFRIQLLESFCLACRRGGDSVPFGLISLDALDQKRLAAGSIGNLAIPISRDGCQANLLGFRSGPGGAFGIKSSIRHLQFLVCVGEGELDRFQVLAYLCKLRLNSSSLTG